MTLAILSWGAHKTLRNTLESYKKFGLDQEKDKIIYFQEISAEDMDIACEYGYDYMGTDTNIGIGPAYAQLVRHAAGEFFLFIENDWELIEPPEVQLSQAQSLLKQEFADVIKLRHRINPGVPLWSRQFEGNELSHPEFLLDSIHWGDPARFEQIKVGAVPRSPHIFNTGWDWWYITTAAYANWTNNPTMFRTEWLRDNIQSRMIGDIEKSLQPWWVQQDFKVAQSQGLFTHMRLDR